MTIEEITACDPTGMFSWLADFPKQVAEAVQIGKRASLKINVRGIRTIVLTGLGGSAIAGDLLRSYLAEELSLPFIVSRHYLLPDFVDRHSLVIVSSYSGMTEETVSAYKDAIRRKAKILCITTGGTIEKLAARKKHPVIKIPGGLQPRAAIGYSFFSTLYALIKLGFIRSKVSDVSETILLLRKKSLLFRDPSHPDNLALHLATSLYSNLPIIYSPVEHLDAVNVRWRGQIAENAKQLAFGHVLPEMNHNELVGWNIGEEWMKKMHVLFLRDRKTHHRIAAREEITKQLLLQKAGNVTEVWSEGKSLLARMFSLLYLGDWTSYYLAILNKVDPVPVEVISRLKDGLAKL
ncbi:MAG: bifunctional phosphoglucose/phosphomannose isomerase [bacterium]